MAGSGAERQDDGELVEDDGGIFDKHGIGKGGLFGKGDDASAERGEKRFVGAVLGAGLGEINGLARDESELTVDDAGTDGARDGGEHGGKVYTRGGYGL